MPPSIRGLGFAGGFELRVEDREGVGLDELQARAQELAAAATASENRVIGQANATIRAGVPQVYLNIDRVKAEKMGVPASAIFNTLQANLGSFYVNDFNKFGRTYRVQMMADAPYRSQPEDLGAIYVRSTSTREMIPLKTLIRTTSTVGPEQLERFNGFVAARVLGNGRPGVSSG